jgi:hypothetical protein
MKDAYPCLFGYIPPDFLSVNCPSSRQCQPHTGMQLFAPVNCHRAPRMSESAILSFLWSSFILAWSFLRQSRCRTQPSSRAEGLRASSATDMKGLGPFFFSFLRFFSFRHWSTKTGLPNLLPLIFFLLGRSVFQSTSSPPADKWVSSSIPVLQ